MYALCIKKNNTDTITLSIPDNIDISFGNVDAGNASDVIAEFRQALTSKTEYPTILSSIRNYCLDGKDLHMSFNVDNVEVFSETFTAASYLIFKNINDNTLYERIYFHRAAE